MRKACTRCGEEKDATTEFFGRQAQKRDGLTPHCKACSAVYDAARDREARAARLRTKRKTDPEWFAAAERRKREKHREKLNARTKVRKAAWKKNNPENYRRSWQKEAAKPERKAAQVLRAGRRYREDLRHNLVCRLRTRIYRALKGEAKSASTKALLGCSIPDLVAHMESLFQPGMTWDNRGAWEIDHIRPLASFDLPAQIAEACHYTNLQPLWRSDNRRKKDKWKP